MMAGPLLFCLAFSGCDDDDGVLVPAQPPPDAPVGVQVSYYARIVTVSWEIGSGWDGEPFRVYSKRSTDPEYFFIAEVTSCASGVCFYYDNNVVADVTYQYYVSAIDPDTGLESASASVQVFVPQPTPPPVPDGVEVIALDNAVFVRWTGVTDETSEFVFYRVYVDAGGGTEFFLGETDSGGFLDLVAINGETYTYFVTSVDDRGHESDASLTASGTPRPDYHGEWLYAFSDSATMSGFRFQTDEGVNPIVDGGSPDRHFRLEVDLSNDWWLVPAPGSAVHPDAQPTTALKCGVAADSNCVDVQHAPTAGYSTAAQLLATQTSYVLRVLGDDNLTHYGVIRVELLGFDQDDKAIMIFDWAYQMQANNTALVTRDVADDVRLKW